MNHPRDFLQALQEKVPRPFVFGPVEFVDLEKGFEEEGRAQREMVVSNLLSSGYMGEGVCIHGFKV